MCRFLGFVAPFMYLESMVDGVLKGLGEQLATFRYSLLDSILRITAIWFVVPKYGMMGFLGGDGGVEFDDVLLEYEEG